MTTPTPAPAAGSSSVIERVRQAIEQHIVPAVRKAKAEAEKLDAAAETLVSEAIKLETVIQTADPALAKQLETSAAVIRDIAAVLPEVAAVLAAL